MKSTGVTMTDREATLGIEAVQHMLEELKVSKGWSNTKLKEEVRQRGICLRNAHEYGKRELKRRIKSEKDVPEDEKFYIVRKEEAKGYPLAKMCLVKV